MARKLASVQYVHDIWPIEGADRSPTLSASLSMKVINNDYLLKQRD